MSDQEFYTVGEALRRLGLRWEELETLVSDGRVRAIRDGGSVMLRAADVEEHRSRLGSLKMPSPVAGSSRNAEPRKEWSEEKIVAVIFGIGCGIPLVLCIALAVFTWLVPDTKKVGRNLPPQPQDNAKPLRRAKDSPQFDAWLYWEYSKEIVKQGLISPGSAKFPGDGGFWDTVRPEQHVRNIGHDTYEVYGWVDSQNAFGALLRTNWTCTFRKTGDTYTFLDVSMDH